MLARLAAQLLWPARCAACSVFVPPPAIFCGDCAVSVVTLEATCPGCGLPLGDGQEGVGGERCRGCGTRPFPFSRAWAALAYGGATTQAILHLKHGRRRHLARSLGALLSPLLRAATETGIDTLCPVPLHPRRLRSRGFNQALELARAARRGARLRILCDSLCRLRDTPALGRATPEQRRKVLDGAFGVPRPAEVRSRRVLLVDDVMTTGATAAACTAALLAAGATEVQVAALARAL